MSALACIHVTPGPSVREPTGVIEDRWCFKCHARLPHENTVVSDPLPSYYEPILIYACSGCDEDHTRFPS